MKKSGKIKEKKRTQNLDVGSILIARNSRETTQINTKTNIGKKIISTKAITLISLVITIILLIILAGVIINVSLGENGLINKTKSAVEKYKIEEIRETVEIGILDIETEEQNLENEITIERMLQELLDKSIFESIDKEASVGYIGEYEVKLKYNENNKVVIEYIQKATGVRVTYTLDPSTYTNKEEVNILLKVQGKVKSVTKPDGLMIYPKNEPIAIDYKVTSNGEYKFIVENEGGTKTDKNVIVDTIDTLKPKDFEISIQNILQVNNNIKFEIIAKTEDEEETKNEDGNLISAKSGIDYYEYYVVYSDNTEEKYKTNEIRIQSENNFYIYAIAYDKAGNFKKSEVFEYDINLLKNSIKIVPSTTEPTNQNIQVKVDFGESSEYIKKEISIDGGLTYSEYIGEVEIEKNTTIKAKLTTTIGEIEEEYKVNNIDKLAPVNFTLSTQENISSTELTVTSNGLSDHIATEEYSQSGIERICFYAYQGDTLISTTSTGKLTNLVAGESYDIYAEAFDKAGNSTKTEVISYTKQYVWKKYNCISTNTVKVKEVLMTTMIKYNKYMEAFVPSSNDDYIYVEGVKVKYNPSSLRFVTSGTLGNNSLKTTVRFNVNAHASGWKAGSESDYVYRMTSTTLSSNGYQYNSDTGNYELLKGVYRCSLYKEYTYSQGSYTGATVSSNDLGEYPANGYKSGYWYVKN